MKKNQSDLQQFQQEYFEEQLSLESDYSFFVEDDENLDEYYASYFDEKKNEDDFFDFESDYEDHPLEYKFHDGKHLKFKHVRKSKKFSKKETKKK